MGLYHFSATYHRSICTNPCHRHLRNYSILLFLEPCIVDVFSLSRVAFAFCISQVLSIRSLRDFLVHENTKTAKSAWPSIFLSSAAANNSVTRWMLLCTINSLTSILERRIGLLFEFDNFLGESSWVVEMWEDLAFRESL